MRLFMVLVPLVRIPDHPTRALRSKHTGQFVRVSDNSTGGRSFRSGALVLWNQLPVWFEETDTMSVIKNWI